MNTSTRFATWVFRIAGIYGVAVMTPMLFLEEKMGIDNPPPINHPENFYGFVLVVIAWAVLFLFISRDPLRFRPMMIPAMLEKFPFAIAVAILFSQGRVTEMMLPFAVIDAVLGILFMVSYLRTKEPASV